MGDVGWLERQNASEAIVSRAASDRYWEVVQRWRTAEFVVFVLVPTGLAIVAQFIHTIGTGAAVVGFAMTLVDAAIAYPLIATARRRAAQAQDRFDSLALSLPESRIRQLGGPDTAETFAAAASQSKKRAKYNRNWYSPKLGTLDIEMGRIACMRESTAWDGGLRDRYVRLIAVAVIFILLAFIVYGVQAALTMEEFVVRILFPLTPAILWAGREIWDNREASETVNRLRSVLADLWSDALQGRASREVVHAQVIELQSAIFAYRQATSPVPDLLYRPARGRATATMEQVAEDLVEQYNRASIQRRELGHVE